MHNPSFIRETPYWRLTISFWPDAAKAGVKPCLPPEPYPSEDEWLPNYYQPTDIDFAHPPTRADFLQLVRQIPWMKTFESELLPAIEQNDWPMIDTAHKASHVYLLDSEGRECGELKVWRQYASQNRQYFVPIIFCEAWDKVTCRLKNPDSEALNMLRYRCENRIQERIMLAEDTSDERVNYEIRLVLHEAGHLKTRPKLPKKAA